MDGISWNIIKKSGLGKSRYDLWGRGEID